MLGAVIAHSLGPDRRIAPGASPACHIGPRTLQAGRNVERAAPYPWEADGPLRQGRPSTSPGEALMAPDTTLATKTTFASLVAIDIAPVVR